MRLTFNGTVYRIGFRHGNETNEIPGHGPVLQNYTIATIRQGEKDETAENIVASAKVHRFYKDPPSQESARKHALRAALKSMNASQEFRTEIWAAYHSRPGGLKARPTNTATATSTV
jgi:hypothetical protein